MTFDEIIAYVEALGGVLTLRPGPGDGTPELAWGDVFLYYAPDGVVPRSQPFATLVTKDYPDDQTSRLDRPGAFRVNVAAGSEEFARWTGHQPRDATPPRGSDLEGDDVVLPHPVYGSVGWLCVTNPAGRTEDSVRHLLRTAHDQARARHHRRSASPDDTD